LDENPFWIIYLLYSLFGIEGGLLVNPLGVCAGKKIKSRTAWAVRSKKEDTSQLYPLHFDGHLFTSLFYATPCHLVFIHLCPSLERLKQHTYTITLFLDDIVDIDTLTN